MESMAAYAKGEANRGNEMMVFDWNKAARLIRDEQPTRAGAGLQSDWEWTGGAIYRDGAPVLPDDTYTYLASTWATPELSMDGELQDCFVMESEAPVVDGMHWTSGTYWPQCALDILNGADDESE
jgi:hypothetical protein